MKKVKITQAQEKALITLNKTYGHERAIEVHVRYKNGWVGSYEPLNDMELLDLVDALRIGYEVLPEYKVDQWIKSEGNQIGKITKINERGDIYTDFKEIISGEFYCRIKLPTDGEIAKEKQRRWWAKHGRDWYGYKEKDILNLKGTNAFREVLETNRDGDVLFKGFDEFTCFYDVQGDYQIVCFAEDRKDLK